MSQPPRVKGDHQKAMVKLFRELQYRHNPWTIWSDFVAMAACTLSMIDAAQRDKRLQLYKSTSEKYNQDELGRIAEMFALVVDALEENPDQDFLGELFMMLELGNDHNGQFFTPYCICAMMARISAGNLAAEVEEKGYVSVNDCACGAGALLIAFANEALRLGVNFQEHIEFVGQDIDYTAAMMCYIQLSLHGCPGYVIVGNTLTTPPTEPLTNQNVWYTPLYFSGTWHWRRLLKMLSRINAAVTVPAVADETPVYNLQESKAGQLKLF